MSAPLSVYLAACAVSSLVVVPIILGDQYRSERTDPTAAAFAYAAEGVAGGVSERVQAAGTPGAREAAAFVLGPALFVRASCHVGACAFAGARDEWEIDPFRAEPTGLARPLWHQLLVSSVPLTAALVAWPIVSGDMRHVSGVSEISIRLWLGSNVALVASDPLLQLIGWVRE